MGIITRIENKLGDVVESPFTGKIGLDLLGVEISLKRMVELKRRNILGKVVVPNNLIVILNKEKYEEYEPFFNKFRATLLNGLQEWLKEKGYEFAGKMTLSFKGGRLGDKPFEVLVSYKKANSGDRNKAKSASDVSREEDIEKENKIVIGELVNKKTGERFTVYGNTVVIGRGEDCAIRIDDPTVSRKHAFLTYHLGKVTLQDLETKSGTRVNHERIHKKILSHGGTVVIGCTEFTYIEAEGAS